MRLAHIFASLAVVATALGIIYVAKLTADESLRLAVEDIESDCDDQLSLLLHVNACAFADKYAATNNLSREEIEQLSEYYGIDEFTLVGANGSIVSTTDPGAKAGDAFFTDEQKHQPYRALHDGRCATVRQRFRASATRGDRIMKYFALALPRGRFLQIGFLWESFEREFTRFFLPIFETRLVSQTGFCVVLDEKGKVAASVLGHPDAKGQSAADIGFTSENLAVPLGQIFRARLFGIRCNCMSYPETIARYRIYAVIPAAEQQVPALMLACGVSLVLIMAFTVFRLVLRKFQQQQAKIDALRAEEEAHRAADLTLARSIQRAELRTDGSDGEGYHITALMNAAREVGGDFYDYYELADGRLVLTIADVSGKGIPAAFFMMKARVTLKSSICASTTLAEAIAQANVRLAQNNPAEMFVTAFVGVYDRKTGMLDFVSAGHNPPLVKRVDGSVLWLTAPRCAALGVFERTTYRGAQTTLHSGDRLFLYTDGVTEAMNDAGELYGNGRLEKALACSSDTPIAFVRKDVETFVAGAEPSDDITMLELEIKS